jgi:anti-anti-sigma factor
MLSLTIQKLGNATVIRCAGRITFGSTDLLRIAALQQRRIRTLVIDLADIVAIDAAGLGMLTSLRAWARETSTAFKLMNLTPKVEELLELTNLKSAFEICSAREMLVLLCRAINETEPVRSKAAFPNPIPIDQTLGDGSLVIAEALSAH